MGKSAGAILIGIITIWLLLGPFQSAITDGIHDWRSSSTTENFIVATGAGVTSQNVTLGHDLFQAAASEIISVTSSNVTDAPIASAYSESTKNLTVSGLVASISRTITVVYYAETDDTVMRAIGPFLSVLLFGGCAFAIMFGMWQSVGKGKGR